MEEIAPKKRKVANLDYSKLGRKGKEKSPWNNGPNVKGAKKWRAKKTESIPSLKKKLWKLVSEYVRRRATISEYCSCVTCGETKHWKEMQAGHFIPRAQGMAVYFDLRNIHPQCYRCNINLGGYGAAYSEWMRKIYGQDVIEELFRLSKTTVKLSRGWYLEHIEEFKGILKSLDNVE